ncbi:hypothetical protein [Pseudochrobactrum asaccharolyticum]|uniref:hypothetical protein n=1 Tax=Pseudochrobactrum asaccharolyticum TaxID=354351 RepID=UPI004041F26C
MYNNSEFNLYIVDGRDNYINAGPASIALERSIHHNTTETYEQLVDYNIDLHKGNIENNSFRNDVLFKAFQIYEKMSNVPQTAKNYTNYLTTLTKEYIIHNLFKARTSKLNFSGNSFSNSKGYSVEDIAQNNYFFSGISNHERFTFNEKVDFIKEFCAANTIDTEFPFGTVVNAMATVMLRYNASKDIPSRPFNDAHTVFVEFEKLANNWKPETELNPIIQVASILVVSADKPIVGNSQQEKMKNAIGYIEECINEDASNNANWKIPRLSEVANHLPFVSQIKKIVNFIKRANFKNPTDTEVAEAREIALDSIPIFSNLRHGLKHFWEGNYRAMGEDLISAVPVAGGLYIMGGGVVHGNLLKIMDGGTQLAFDVSMARGTTGDFRPSDIISTERQYNNSIALLNQRTSLSEVNERYAQSVNHNLLPLRNIGIERAAIEMVSNSASTTAHLSRYKIAKPLDLLFPDKILEINKGRHGNYINMQNNWYKVEFDNNNNTWRIVSRDNPTAYKVPVRLEKGQWVEHNHVGLRGGVLPGIVWPSESHSFYKLGSGLDKTFYRSADDTHQYGWVQVRNTPQNQYGALRLIKEERDNINTLSMDEDLNPLIVKIPDEKLKLPAPSLIDKSIPLGYYVEDVKIYIEIKPYELAGDLRTYQVNANNVIRTKLNGTVPNVDNKSISDIIYTAESFAEQILKNEYIKNNIDEIIRSLEIIRDKLPKIGLSLQELSIAFTNDGKVKLFDYGGNTKNRFGDIRGRTDRLFKNTQNIINQLREKRNIINYKIT